MHGLLAKGLIVRYIIYAKLSHQNVRGSKFSFLYALFVTNLSAYGKRIHPNSLHNVWLELVLFRDRAASAIL